MPGIRKVNGNVRTLYLRYSQIIRWSYQSFVQEVIYACQTRTVNWHAQAKLIDIKTDKRQITER